MPLARINLQASIAMLLSAFSFKLADQVHAFSQLCARTLQLILIMQGPAYHASNGPFLFSSGMANRLFLPVLAKGRDPLKCCKVGSLHINEAGAVV